MTSNEDPKHKPLKLSLSQVVPHIPSAISISIEGPIVFLNLQVWDLRRNTISDRVQAL